VTWSVVRLTPADWRAHRDLRLEALRTDPEAFGSTYAENAAFDEAQWRARLEAVTYWQAREGGMPVGMVGLWEIVTDDVLFEDAVPLLIGMFVRPAARGRGVGEALVRTVMAEARARGHLRLLLDVRVANASARSLYARCGFVETGDPMPEQAADGCEVGMLADLAVWGA